MNRRFEVVDRQFEAMKQKIDNLNVRFDQLFTILLNQRQQPQ
ncbi:MAG: hypothetical protein ACE5GG_01780 [Candidatus Omnitrophota bacterium]